MLRRTIAAGAACILVACGGSPTRDSGLTVDDTTTIPSLRMSIGTASEQAPNDPHNGFAFELGLSQATGSSTQNLGAGDRVSVDSQAVTGPAQISNKADLRIIDANVRWRIASTSSPWVLELLAGIVRINSDFTAGPVRSSQDSNGGTLGIGGLYRLSERTSLHARYMTSSGVSSSVDDLTLRRLEFSVVQAFGRNIAGRLGYSTWDMHTVPPAPGSERSVNLSGPMLGLDLSF